MTKQLREHVEQLFRNTPNTPRAFELKEELIANLTDRYNDLLAQGETEEVAYGIAVAGIGNVDDLLDNLREQEIWRPSAAMSQRSKSALLISVAVGLFIVSVIFPIIAVFLVDAFDSRIFMVFGLVLMFVCIAFGVGLLVYNSQSKLPQGEKTEEPVIERFSPPAAQKRGSSYYKTIQSLIWTATAPVFLLLGFLFHAWHPGWMVFLLAPVLSHVVHLIHLHQDGE